MRTVSIVCVVIYFLCVLADHVIKYVGGRVCRSLSILYLLPAEAVPGVVGFFTGVFLLGAVVWSLVTHRDIRWTAGALLTVLALTATHWLGIRHLHAFLHGLRDRFVSKIGYARMRQFAEEVSRPDALADIREILSRPYTIDSASPEQIEHWNNLVSRYPFLAWNFRAATFITPNGLVEVRWGSALTGHWGFQVAPGGEVTDLDPDRAWFLRVAKDIQFVNYFD